MPIQGLFQAIEPKREALAAAPADVDKTEQQRPHHQVCGDQERARVGGLLAAFDRDEFRRAVLRALARALSGLHVRILP